MCDSEKEKKKVYNAIRIYFIKKKSRNSRRWDRRSGGIKKYPWSKELCGVWKRTSEKKKNKNKRSKKKWRVTSRDLMTTSPTYFLTYSRRVRFISISVCCLEFLSGDYVLELGMKFEWNQKKSLLPNRSWREVASQYRKKYRSFLVRKKNLKEAKKEVGKKRKFKVKNRWSFGILGRSLKVNTASLGLNTRLTDSPTSSSSSSLTVIYWRRRQSVKQVSFRTFDSQSTYDIHASVSVGNIVVKTDRKAHEEVI